MSEISSDVVDVGPAEESLRTSDRLARALFAQLRGRSIHERRFVLQALLSAGRSNSISPQREQVMKVSLLTFKEETGLVPTVRTYDQWRREKSDRGLCSSGQIIRQFSTWSNALHTLGIEPKPDPTARRLLSRGQQMSDEQALQALRDCAEDLGTDNFTIAQYEKWAKQELLKPENKGRKIPISKSIVTRRFGSVRQAKIAAGLDPDTAYHASSFFTDEEVLDALRRARSEIEGRLSTAKYTIWRKGKQEEARARGKSVTIPCDFTISQHFGGWLKAVSLIEGLPVTPHEHRGPPVYTPDWLAERLLEAYDEIGEPFFTSTYIEWTRKKREEQNLDFPPPDYTTIRRHGGSWTVIRDKLREAVETGELAPLVEQLSTGGGNHV
jgi:hypothetical protein